jgi:hypothetical protein
MMDDVPFVETWPPSAANAAGTKTPDVPPGQVAAHKFRPLGVCFSGGGIRSATFHLGVIQGLCQQGLLPYIDYLSTVSGGGFIGAWLHGVILRKHRGDPVDAQPRLIPGGKPAEPECDPVTFLRKYSNYLAPHLGIFSADTWTIAGVWLRNMALNLLILIPFLAAVNLLARLLGMVQLAYGHTQTLVWWSWAIAILVAVIIMSFRLLLIVRREFDEKWLEWVPKLFNGDTSSWTAVILVMLAAYILGAAPSISRGWTFWRWFTVFGVLHLLLQWLGGFPWCYRASHKKDKIRWAALGALLVIIPAVCALVTSGGMTLALTWLDCLGGPKIQWIPIVVGPALMILVWTGGVVLQIGLIGADFPDTAREWLTQFAALLGITAAMWTGAFALSVFGPLWLAQLAIWKGYAAVTAIGGWITAGLSSYFAGASSKTKGTDDTAGAKQTSLNLERVAAVAPPIFMALTLLLISFGAHMAVRAVAAPSQTGDNCSSIYTDKPAEGPLWLVHVRDQYWCYLHPPKTGTLPVATLVRQMSAWAYRAVSDPGAVGTAVGTMPAPTPILCLAGFLMTVLLSLRFNINEFSMHHFYKNRLVRCYLGAGNAQKREPDFLTGFDPKDDFHISCLQPNPLTNQRPYNGPYPIVNCALNLNAGSELATAERKASSFVFTPKVCGFEPTHSRLDVANTKLSWEGYRETAEFMMPGGPDLGTVTAISGAAANPNDGYHTSTPMAFLLTVFDVRLGWWVGNPRRATKARRPGPTFALMSLLSELFAQTTNRSNYVNLSDGGHFENLGLYELVRRRCRYIIAGDAEEDPHYSFEALGGAIRKCRADFGVEIDIDIDSLKPTKESPYSKGHCVVGTIRYPEAEMGAAFPMCAEAAPRNPKELEAHMHGWLVYFKASMTGDEPEDIQEYQGSHPVFPHEPTSDQFFTESQFESYRRLGEHVVAATFDRITKPTTGPAQQRLLELFRDLYRKWHPAGGTDNSGNFTERYSSLMDRIASDSDLEFVGAEFFPNRTPKAARRKHPEVDRKAFYFCLDAIQLMEDVFFAVGFASRSMQANPEYAGWMSTFRIWAASTEVKKTWAIARGGYSILFQEFFDQL